MALTDKQKQMYAAVEAVLAEQARAAEQGASEPAKEPLCRCPEGACGLHPGATTCSMRGDAQIVERMHSVYGREHDHQKGLGADRDTCERYGLIAALTVAREGYVSLEKRDAQWEKAIHASWRNAVNRNFDLFLEEVRMRLAKPAEQTDEAPTYKLPSTHSDPPYMKCSFCGALVIDKVLHTKWHAALKAGKHD